MNNGAADKLSEIFSDVFGFRGELGLDIGRKDIANWDSFQHVTLVESLENAFNIRISMDEMIELQDVKSILNVLSRYDIS